MSGEQAVPTPQPRWTREGRILRDGVRRIGMAQHELIDEMLAAANRGAVPLPDVEQRDCTCPDDDNEPWLGEPYLPVINSACLWHGEAVHDLTTGVTTGNVRFEKAIYAEVEAERKRAQRKHGDTSMASLPADDPVRLAVLAEEVGEVARVLNDARHSGTAPDRESLRQELVQVAAMAVAWVDAIERGKAER